MIASEVREMLSFIDGNPTAYHTTAAVRDILLKAGFAELLESRKWALEPGKDYFVCRNGSSIIAFRMGDQLENYSFNVAAAHTDSPCFRIKENAEIHMGQNYTKLNTEGYGGMICATWMDRPLSVAGRVLVQENGAIVSRLVALDRDLLMIPSVAIHMNREVNDKASFNKQVDMLPVLGGACEEGALKKLIAEELKVSEEQILGSDLFLYVREKATVWGCNEEFISCGRLDDQQCVYGILKGLLTAKNARSIGVAAFFDNEEVGSGTKQGAASTFLYDVLHRIAQSLGGNVYHVCRGSVLELEGKSYLCFGGAESQDKDDREPGVNWWKQEMPSDEEYDTCRRNLEKVDYKVDYVLTHDAPSRFLDFTALALGESNRLHLFLDEILLKLTYEKWFFGCYHKDVQLSTKSRCVFCDVIPMGERRTGLFRR